MSDRVREDLIEGLSNTLVGTDEMIEHVMAEAERAGISPYAMRNSDGTYVMAPLLLAKATTLAALVAIRE